MRGAVHMAKLPKLELVFDKRKETWELRSRNRQIVDTFGKKADALKGAEFAVVLANLIHLK